MRERRPLGAISPFFIVTDVSQAVRFYEERLGFELRFSEPVENPFFAIVGRDSVQIFLKSVSEAITAHPNHTRHEWALWDAFVYVDDPDSLAAEFASRGLIFAKRLSIVMMDCGASRFRTRTGTCSSLVAPIDAQAASGLRNQLLTPGPFKPTI